MTEHALSHRFVGMVPERLDPATLYVSVAHATAVHLCACGCGSEVVTPISPDGWILGWDGDSVSLSPSVGSANLACASHYFIRSGHVVWLPPMRSQHSPLPPKRPSVLDAIRRLFGRRADHGSGGGL